MHYLLFYDVVDDYVNRRAPFRAEHLGYAQRFYDEGELVMAGALAEPADGGVFVFRREEPAKEFAENDPYVQNGLVKAWRVRRWMTVFGDGATLPNV